MRNLTCVWQETGKIQVKIRSAFIYQCSWESFMCWVYLYMFSHLSWHTTNTAWNMPRAFHLAVKVLQYNQKTQKGESHWISWDQPTGTGRIPASMVRWVFCEGLNINRKMVKEVWQWNHTPIHLHLQLQTLSETAQQRGHLVSVY